MYSDSEDLPNNRTNLSGMVTELETDQDENLVQNVKKEGIGDTTGNSSSGHFDYKLGLIKMNRKEANILLIRDASNTPMLTPNEKVVF